MALDPASRREELLATFDAAVELLERRLDELRKLSHEALKRLADRPERVFVTAPSGVEFEVETIVLPEKSGRRGDIRVIVSVWKRRGLFAGLLSSNQQPIVTDSFVSAAT